MRAIIIEDEKPAAEKLQKAILKADTGIDVVATLSSVKSAIEWLEENDMPNLLFMDIELSDGLSFKIFDAVNITSPVIFCTAFDEYWQEAFEHNSIDYLLKPVRQEKLDAALKKYDKLKQHFSADVRQFLQSRQQQLADYKKRFLVKRGTDYISVKTDDIAYFYATHKLVCMIDQKNQKFILDQSLSEIEKQLDPSMFYRVNRKYLVHLNAIRKIRTFPKSKLQLELEPEINEDIIISQDNVTAFKEWMSS
ncbi:LytTR family DNA-binding domain-containing protein [Terrimonas sp. NA20]|uniref:LytTR family DNA-binding domain-containing protein n=1 Tax=Terrimonas ginsenosidimutans TaxID=2908004 RepID=A0ABS9KL79_9BACT|nr:LytTR family DNA-binding domain-containing protein [Terrimonas ginsenosidimutans]MCG2613071.1 LytTR family DNA-binding domain-containing protein [Terrimonas ginsenosidimutans]